MKVIKYLIFLIFNHYYKDGNYKEVDDPYFTSMTAIMAYESFIIIVTMYCIEHQFNLSFFTTLLSPLENMVYGRGIVLCALIYPLNHYYFLKKNNLDHIYNEFKDSPINTKRNRRLGHICLLLYLPIMIGIAIFVNHWFK